MVLRAVKIQLLLFDKLKEKRRRCGGAVWDD